MNSDVKPMAFVAAEGGGAPPIQMAPLIDCVFLLICFYLFVSESVKNQDDPTVNLPRMTSGLAKTEAPAEVVINLRADGQVRVDAQSITLAELNRFLKDEQFHAARDGRPLRVVVRADRTQRFGALDDILRTCREAGMSAVVLRAKEEDSP